MGKSGVEEWLVQAVMALYSGVRTMLAMRKSGVEEWAGISSDDIV